MPTVRLLSPQDSYAEITDLLHEAYAPLAAAGMKFRATQQSVDETRERCERGICFVAEDEGRLIGTITLYGPEPNGQSLHYRAPGNFHFGQFAVLPEYQGRWLGKLLLEQVEAEAVRLGASNLALDTSERAGNLISLYHRWGFVEVERVNWGDSVNYGSVILSKTLST